MRILERIKKTLFPAFISNTAVDFKTIPQYFPIGDISRLLDVLESEIRVICSYS